MRHPRYDRIVRDPEKCLGKPIIRGLRIPVASVLKYLSSGMTVDDVLREWPELEREDVLQALAFASLTMEEQMVAPEAATHG